MYRLNTASICSCKIVSLFLLSLTLLFLPSFINLFVHLFPRRYKLKEEASKPQKTAEERELETIQKMQQEAKQRLILSQKSLKRTRAAARTNSQATINPVKSDKPLTEAVGFHFRTEERLKKRSGCRPRGLSPSTSAEFISKFPYSLREDSSVTKVSDGSVIAVLDCE